MAECHPRTMKNSALTLPLVTGEGEGGGGPETFAPHLNPPPQRGGGRVLRLFSK